MQLDHIISYLHGQNGMLASIQSAVAKLTSMSFWATMPELQLIVA